MNKLTEKRLEGLLAIIYIPVRMENNLNTEKRIVYFQLEDFANNAKAINDWVKKRGYYKWYIDEDRGISLRHEEESYVE